MSELPKLWAKYNDYISNGLLHDSPEELMGWDEFASLHGGISKDDADAYLSSQMSS